ncbi:MAG: HAD-IC family P-type ATPase [Clostridia bacterium]|nr:HAD-IC family P-type ATPase [Clostridia bacterium]
MAEKKAKTPVSENKETTKRKKTSEAVKSEATLPQPVEAENKKKLKFSFSFPKKKEKPNPSVEVKRFRADADIGLSAAQVEERINQGLVNKATKKYSKSYRSIFIGNICTFFNLLCLLAAVALMLARAPLTQYLFVLIFLANIVFSIALEIRAKRKLDKLSILSSPITKAVRNGVKVDIPVEQIVIDDVLVLVAGQQVPADCIAIDGNAELNESLLTGESVPIKKEEGDFVYAGSFVASGRLAVRVDKIGDDTYISKLTARAKKYKRPNSEIMNSITMFIKIIGLVIVPLAVLMFLNNFRDPSIGGANAWSDLAARGGFWKNLFAGDEIISEAIQTTASVVIGMIPSGLLLLTTVALSTGMIRLAKYNTLVQDMYSLEMLARVNVLCLDKTGTITDGRMKVSDCILLNNSTEYGIDEIIGSMLASLEDNNQTSIALYERFGHSTALTPMATLPFSSARKLSAVTFEGLGTFVLGAPEFVLKPMPTRVDKIVKQYAQMGLRVMVIAHSVGQLQGEKVPVGLKAMAIITLSDNIRPDAVDTIRWFKENDVAVKVISGDNPVTVSEVARRAGINNASQFISLEGLSDIEVENAANQYTVFGRVTPEQKAILIRSIKQAGNTVAMTGDGVNDILAMKEADCAVSVASGSEAARNVSNLVLQDSNFGSMPKIVNEGRRVINNVKNSASLYIMKTLLILTLSVICLALRSKYFFKTNNMLMYEFCISAIPSMVLSLQPNNERVKGKFIPYVLSRAIPGALTMALGIMTLYAIRQMPIGEAFGFVSQGASTIEYDAIMMVALTFCGIVMLYRICQPFNVLRAVLFLLTAALCIIVVSVPLLGEIVFDGWADVVFTLPQILLILIIILISFPISATLIKLFDMINPADELPLEKKN